MISTAHLATQAHAGQLVAGQQVANQAAHALRRSSHPALRHLSVVGNEGNLIISGKVTSYYLKQLAQETIMSLREGMQLVNKVDVVH